jgi:hypothetical protein
MYAFSFVSKPSSMLLMSWPHHLPFTTKINCMSQWHKQTWDQDVTTNPMFYNEPNPSYNDHIYSTCALGEKENVSLDARLRGLKLIPENTSKICGTCDFPVNNIPPKVHSNTSFTYHPCCIILVTDRTVKNSIKHCMDTNDCEDLPKCVCC